MEPREETQPQVGATGVAARRRARVAALQDRGHQLVERAQAERARHDSVDVLFEMADRDGEAGGGVIAGALSYRMFLWLLPLTLVSVAGLGIASNAASQSPEEAAKTLGVTGLVTNSVATAAEGPGRWYALLVGIPVLVWVTRSLLRALTVTHRLLWGDVRSAAPKPTLHATLRLLVLLLGLTVVSGVAGAVRAWSSAPGVLVTLLTVVPYAVLWLLISLRLPHRDADWKALVPGALLFGAGLQALHLVAAYVLAPYAITKQGTYGALGAAAALLLGLFLLSRIAVAGAVLNVTLWERRGARTTHG